MRLRIKEWRKRRGVTLEQLADQLGSSPAQISRLENGRRRINADWLSSLAAALGCRVVDLIDDEAGIPIVGRVGAGATVYSIDDYPLGQGPRMARCPLGLDPSNTVAVEVEGDSMLPIDNGWLLFYSRDYDGVPSECLGQLCVVQVADDGPQYVKRVKPGRGASRFNLYSTNAREMEDMALAWAARVLHAGPSQNFNA